MYNGALANEIGKSKFVSTRRVSDCMEENAEFHKEIKACIDKYFMGDWGNLCKSDKAMNDNAVGKKDRVFAKYETCEGDIYIITEQDRSTTTVLFTDEY